MLKQASFVVLTEMILLQYLKYYLTLVTIDSHCIFCILYSIVYICI